MKKLILNKIKFLPAIIQRTMFWHFKYVFFRSITPLACGCYITSRCNYRCTFCNITRQDYHFTLSENFLRNLIDELGKKKTIYFSISGGEPLLVPYVFDILRYAKKEGILYTHLVSNGALITPLIAKKLQDALLDEISISLDGSPEYHDKVRAPKAFEKVCDAIENLRVHAPKVEIVINTRLDPSHLSEIQYVRDFCEKGNLKFKVQPINHHHVFSKDEFVKIDKRLVDSQELTEVVHQLLKSKNIVNSKAFLRNILSHFQYHRTQLSEKKCIFGYHHLEVFGESTVFPCLEGLHWAEGFRFSGSLNEVFDSPAYQAILSSLKKCSGCNENMYVCYYEPRLTFPVWNYCRNLL